ncbi:putative fungal specific transcription factor [Rosellinia necatrix]|uniref:Putative fungal specific transcription factor n=1 Tax=Rosellinia necatrix TaxID=77044 RepID=A0A1S7UL25_ROSNE|nr:putative fungal specific transcription factor [Rosellinia necatrix]
MPKGLAASRWASDLPRVTSWPRPPPPRTYPPIRTTATTTPSSSSHPTSRNFINTSPGLNSRNDQPSSPAQQLSRFLKIVARLKWKIPFLEIGYATAVDRVGKPQQEIDANEIHFKLDFHEFYMLIERALVHLMGVYGIVIYAQCDPNGNGYGVGNAPDHDLGAFRDRSQRHSYHENVLLALGDPANPLHGTLGREDVRKQFARAKELRNRWKNADDANACRFMPAPLEAYNLKQILQTILLALEQAYFVTEQFVRQQTPGVDQNEPVSTADWTTDSDDWEFMVDAMDWEVV